MAEQNSRAFSDLHPFQCEIVRLVNEGHSRKDVCEYVTSLGYTGRITQFYEYCRFLVADGLIEPPVKLQRNQLLDIVSKQKYHYVTRHQLFRFMWSNCDDVEESDWQRIVELYPVVNVVNECITKFRNLFETKCQNQLEIFLAKYEHCDYGTLARFATNLRRDFIPVSHAVTSPYSNGFVEGVNNKLKMIKRVAFGRSSLKLLKAKILLNSIFLTTNTHICG